MTKAEFESLTPRQRGYAVYWFGNNPDQPHVPSESNPYPDDTREHGEWNEGQMRAVLNAQDMEE